MAVLSGTEGRRQAGVGRGVPSYLMPPAVWEWTFSSGEGRPTWRLWEWDLEQQGPAPHSPRASGAGPPERRLLHSVASGCF